MPDPHAGSESGPGIRVAAGLFAGAILLAAVDAGVIAHSLPLPSGGVPLRVAHHVFDAAETLGIGAVAAAGVGAFAWFVRIPRWASALVAVAVCAALVHVAIGEELTRVASLALEGRFERAIFVGFILFLGALLPAATAVAALL